MRTVNRSAHRARWALAFEMKRGQRFNFYPQYTPGLSGLQGTNAGQGNGAARSIGLSQQHNKRDISVLTYPTARGGAGGETRKKRGFGAKNARTIHNVHSRKLKMALVDPLRGGPPPCKNTPSSEFDTLTRKCTRQGKRGAL